MTTVRETCFVSREDMLAAYEAAQGERQRAASCASAQNAAALRQRAEGIEFARKVDRADGYGKGFSTLMRGARR